MNTINCRIKVNEHHDVPGIGLTPAECVLLRHIHDPAAANFSKSAPPAEKKNFWKFLVNPVAADVAKTVIPGDDDEQGDIIRERTNAEEVARLRSKYNVRAKGGAQGSHIMDDLYPGESPDLPETFEEIGLEVAPPVAKQPKQKKVAKAPASAPNETSDGAGEAGQPPAEPGEAGGQEEAPETAAPKASRRGRAPKADKTQAAA